MTDKEKLEKIKALADKMYSSMAYLTSDTRPIRQAMDEYHQFITNEYHKEEPVSEDLEEAAKHYLYSNILYDDVYVGNPTDKDCIKMFKAGAKWQKERIMANYTNATIGLPYENKYGGYTHLIDVSRPLPVGNNKIAIIFKED